MQKVTNNQRVRIEPFSLQHPLQFAYAFWRVPRYVVVEIDEDIPSLAYRASQRFKRIIAIPLKYYKLPKKLRHFRKIERPGIIIQHQ
jgi:hypothetical protein